MNRLFQYSAILLLVICGTSCKKSYYNCTCTYLNEYDETDTMLLAVRARNTNKARKGCAQMEVDITYDEGYYLFCRLQ